MHNRLTPKLVLRALFSLVLVLSTTPSIPAAHAAVSSGSILFNGTDMQYLSIPANANYAFAGNFTIETWVKFNRFTLFQQFLGQAIASNGWSLQMMPSDGNTTGRLRLTGRYSGTNPNAAPGDYESNVVFTQDKWYHIALVRNSNVLTIYVNGVANPTTKNFSEIFGKSTEIYTVGAGLYSGSDRFQGYISNIRILNNAIYTSNFTPSTSPLTAATGTVLLLNTTNDGNYLKDNSTLNNTITAINSTSPGVNLPVANASAPFISLSSASETALVGTAITGYTLTNPNPTETYTASIVGGGAFSSPTNGISFNSTTGVFSGTPTATAAAVSYRITGATSGATAIYSLTVSNSQTITFPDLSPITIGGAVPTLSATASSNLTVAYTSATTSICTVTGTTITVLTTGTCTINANQAGNGTYAAAAQVQKSFVISPVPVVDDGAAVAAAAAAAAKRAAEQKELTEILALIPKIAELTLSLGETTQSLYKQKCVKGKHIKYVKNGAKCPKGYVAFKKSKPMGS